MMWLKVQCLQHQYIKRWWVTTLPSSSSSSLCAICSQQVGCHGSPSFSILCHSDTVILWYFCPFLDVIRPHCSRSPPSSSTIYPSYHQQSLYTVSSYYVRTLYQPGKFENLIQEMQNVNLDILGIAETHWTENQYNNCIPWFTPSVLAKRQLFKNSIKQFCRAGLAACQL